jgi:hypothetical protein
MRELKDDIFGMGGPLEGRLRIGGFELFRSGHARRAAEGGGASRKPKLSGVAILSLKTKRMQVLSDTWY